MGEKLINPSHNVFKQYKKMNLVNPYMFLPTPNTFIGGVAATINTPALIASKLGIAVDRIKSFSIIGNDIQFAVIGNYNIPNACFMNNSSLTYFLDNGGLVLKIDSNGFRACVNLSNINFPKCNEICIGSGFLSFYQCSSLVNVSFPECLRVWTQSFASCSLLKIIDLPKLTETGPNIFSECISLEMVNMKKCISLSLGGDNLVFSNIKSGCIINVNIFLKTSNGGVADGDLLYAKNSRNAIVNFYDDNGNYVSTL
jgi:hypothetical protein